MWFEVLCSPKQKTKTHKCHTAWSLLNRRARSHVFLFPIFFSSSGANCRRVGYIGMLPGLSCFKWNSLASTPPPPLATMSQTLTSLMVEKKKKIAQCATMVGSDKVQKEKKMGQLHCQSTSADSGVWAASTNATSATAGWALFAGKRNCGAGKIVKKWWLIITENDRMDVEIKC